MAGLLAGAPDRDPVRVVLWARDPGQVEAMLRDRCNRRYLPEFSLPPALHVTGSLEDAMAGADVVVMAVPTRWARPALARAAAVAKPGAVVVNLAKGLEPVTLLTMCQMTSEVLPGHPVAALSGPNLAPEIAMGSPAATVVACAEAHMAGRLQQLFSLPHLRVYTNEDVIGCELAGAVKNVLALGAGMADGWGAGANAKAAIITRGLAELARLGVALGGHPWTFSGLAGLGDVVLTCTSERSRNWTVGFRLGRGEGLAQVLSAMQQVAEGVSTAASVVALGQRHRVELPICEQVASVLEGRCHPSQAVAALLGREATHERAGWPVGGGGERSPAEDARLLA